jgi:hypothetical protein
MDQPPRSLDSNLVLIEIEGAEQTIPEDSFYAEHGIAGLIRIEETDFASVPAHGLFGHFNVKNCSHVPGKNYGVIKLLRHGFFKESAREEQLPLLSALGMRVGICKEVQQNLSYDQLNEHHFQYSFPTIKSVEELQKAILARYQNSLPELSSDEILARGVSFTLLDMK